MKRKLKWAATGLIGLFLVAQFYQPDRSNPPVDRSKTIEAVLNVPPDVRAILDRSCSDCHTNNTKWPWYSYIAPTSWLTARDVRKGRSNLNLSIWGTYKKTRQAGKLDDISEQLTENKMPIAAYRLMHPGSVLSKEEIARVSRWADQESSRLSEPDSTEGREEK